MTWESVCQTKEARSMAMCLDSWYKGALMQDIVGLKRVAVCESLGGRRISGAGGHVLSMGYRDSDISLCFTSSLSLWPILCLRVVARSFLRTWYVLESNRVFILES